MEKAIRQEIREWSFQTLEQPLEEYNGMRGCPYASKSWGKDRVKITFKRDKSFVPLYDALDSFDDSYDVNIVVDLDYEEDQEAFHDRVHDINQAISVGAFGDKDLWIMSSHPDDGDEDLVEDEYFEPSNDIVYGMMYVQRLAKLQQAAYNLERTEYYESVFGDRNPEHVFKTRERFYNKLRAIA
tara:strand:- start:164 stop:715 length:552 start_codon:yes stop_codon:yes gene_type:complete